MRACPFLTQQEEERRPRIETFRGDDKACPGVYLAGAPGLGVQHNPGVAMLWITRTYRVFAVSDDAVAAGAQPGVLFELGEPLVIECYRQSRPATQAEVAAAIAQGVPVLQDTAEREGPRAVAELWQALQAFEQRLAAHVA